MTIGGVQTRLAGQPHRGVGGFPSEIFQQRRPPSGAGR